MSEMRDPITILEEMSTKLHELAADLAERFLDEPTAWMYTHGDPDHPAGFATVIHQSRASFLIAHGWEETPLYARK